MLAMTQGETSSPDNPKLLFVYVSSDPVTGGRVLTPHSLELEVLYPDGTTHSARGAVDLELASYQCGYAPTVTIAGADPVGTYTVNWYARATPSAPEETWSTVFPVFASGTLIPNGYATIAQMRAEGVPSAFSDARIKTAIETASRRIETITRRVFSPYFSVADYDGVGGPIILFQDAVIGICDISFTSSFSSPSELPINWDNLKVYNRHMRGLRKPDDRDNPKIEFSTSGYVFTSAVGEDNAVDRVVDGWRQGRFAESQQNIRISGWFGYTEPDGSPLGGTPPDINYACLIMAMKEVRPKWQNFGGGAGSGSHGNLIQERTRDQTVWYETSSDAAYKAGITGDPAVDQILERFMAPISVGAV